MPGLLTLACVGAMIAPLIYGVGTAGASPRPSAPARSATGVIGTAPPSAGPQSTSARSIPTARRMTFITTTSPSSAVPEVMLAASNGSGAHPLGPAATAVLSPNGQYVAAVAPGSGTPAQGSSLVLYRVSKTSATNRVLRTSTSQLTILAWSPDNRWIAAIDGDALVVVPLHGKARTIATGTINGASFAPQAPDRLVFARAASLLVSADVNLYTVSLSGGKPSAITTDNLSEYPLWGPNGIVFSREASHTAPTYQLWQIKADGRDDRQLTDVPVAAPFYGLEAIAVSGNGKHVLANLIGNGMTQAWAVDLSSHPSQAREIADAGSATIGNAISRDGQVILLTEGSGSLTGEDFAGQSVVIVPWVGGTPTVLAAHAAFASWDR